MWSSKSHCLMCLDLSLKILSVTDFEDFIYYFRNFISLSIYLFIHIIISKETHHV